MAIASVICTCTRCGNSFEHRKTCYNRSDANDYESWAAENITLCPACWRAEQDAKRLAKRDQATANYALPTLTGSERQIAWADKIRGQFIVSIEQYLASGDKPAERIARFRAAVNNVLADHPDCRWWIDTRDEDFRISGVRRDAIRAAIAAVKAASEAPKAAEETTQTAVETPAADTKAADTGRKDPEMKKLYMVEDCTSTRSAVYDTPLSASDSATQAFCAAVTLFSRLTDHDQEDRDNVYVGYADTDDDGCVDYNTMTDIWYIRRDGKPVCYLLNDLDGYGSSTPVCTGPDETARLLRDCAYDAVDPLTACWHEASASEIAEYGTDAEPAPRTLQELTGQESGIVIYPDVGVIVCNWSSYGPGEMPCLVPGIGVDGWGGFDGILAGAKHRDVSDFRPLYAEREIISDASGTLQSIADGTYYWGDDYRATVWTLTDGTTVIAPENWN